jgi:predicted transcriptional regulator
MTIRLPKDLYEKLRREAFERRIPMGTLITDALAAYLEPQ